MKRSHKIVLALMALIDLVVIGTLAFIVICSSNANRRGASPPTPIAYPSECSTLILEALSHTMNSTRVSLEDGSQGFIYLILSSPPSITDSPEAVSPQILWHALDSLPPSLLSVCTIPSTITLVVEIRDETTDYQYAVNMTGETLTNWLLGQIDDGELAALSHYREARVEIP